MASSSSSSSKPRRSYDVFLSFRGTDVRNNFVGHLYTALDGRGINTYMDSEELRTGEQISPALTEAIEESRIAIVVFSENYAFSKWCLDELAKIMECKEQRDLSVFPVFYKVEPREVKTPRKRYLEAMAKHEDKFGKDSEKVKRWKEALLGAGSLSGQHFTDGYEPGFIQDIVREISTRLDPAPLHVAKYPIGIDSRLQELKAILNLQSKDDVLMVGLWGHGGVGKTTLAKAVYNAVFRDFQGSCYLERVRENSNNSNNLVPLQEKLLSQVLLEKSLTVHSDGRGRQLIQDRLCNKKVLIILDDVDDQKQLNALVGNSDWFGQGSRIIITTRDSHLLTSHGVVSDHIYEVKALKNGEALELLRKHASLPNRKIEISSNLVDKVLHYANGLPLALEVLGSFLCGRGEEEWESTLQKLAESPDRKINDVLKVGYEGLEDYAKEIFLDIACFFKGRSTSYIKKVLDSCGFHTTIGLKVLIEHSWISEEGETFQMHDLIQLMGRDIVEEECRDDPGKRSRLWLYDDVRDVLSGDLGTPAVKAIVLELPEPAKIYIGPNAFTKMRKLRLLILHNVHNRFQGRIHFPNELRWFEWPNCASIPKFGGGEKKLVGLDLRNANVQLVLKQLQDCKKLKFINFSGCESVVFMPDLSCAPYLEKLDLHGSKNLEHLPAVLRCKNLQLLDLRDCSKLRRFPNIPDEIKGVRELNLMGTAIEELPASIENFVSLEMINLEDCKNLEILPSSIYRLGNLKTFCLMGCSKLIHFPKAEEDWSNPHKQMGFPKLELLSLQDCNLLEVEFLQNHSCFPSLEHLQLSAKVPTKLNELDVSGFQGIQEILNIPEQSRFEHQWHCKSLSKIPSDICGVDYSADLFSGHEPVRNGWGLADLFKPKHSRPTKSSQSFPLPGGQMPDWLLPNKEGYISFMASKELFKEKFLGLAWCVVFRGKEGQEPVLTFTISVNGGLVHREERRFEVDSDHVWLCYSKTWREEEASGPNDWNQFQFFIRASRDGIVKKCGFRLIFKPLENDLKVLLQHNPFMDPALLHEIRHHDSQTITMEDSPNGREDILDSKTSTEENSSSNLVLKGSNMADFSIQKYRSSVIDDSRKVRPGGEMSKGFVPVEDGTICFMASQDLYDKILGLALCIVFSVEDGKQKVSFDIVPHVDGQRRNVLSGTLGSFDSDHTWFQYLHSNVLWGVLEGGVDFGEFGKNHLQFSLTLKVSGGTMKKLGYVIRCSQLGDDLKGVLENNQLVNLASLWEDSRDPTEHSLDPVYSMVRLRIWSPRYERDYLRKFHLHMEQHGREFRRRGRLHMEELDDSDSETDENRMWWGNRLD